MVLSAPPPPLLCLPGSDLCREITSLQEPGSHPAFPWGVTFDTPSVTFDTLSVTFDILPRGELLGAEGGLLAPRWVAMLGMEVPGKEFLSFSL